MLNCLYYWVDSFDLVYMLLKFHLFPFEKDNQDNSNITISFKLVEFSHKSDTLNLCINDNYR